MVADNQQLQQDTANQAVNDAFGSTSQAKTYSFANLKISSDASQQALHAYGNAVGAILSELCAEYERRRYI